MVEEFAVSHTVNEGSDSLLALNFAVEGSGAALVASSALMGYRRGVIAGLLLVLLGIVFLLLHLGKRLRSWRVLAGLRNAWISRGACFAGGLVLSGAIYLKADAPGVIVTVLTIVCGLLTILYSGFLLASMTSIPFWNSPLTPVLFFFHSITTGLAIKSLMLMQGTEQILSSRVGGLIMALVGTTLLLTIIHIMVMERATNAARESVNLLLKRRLKWWFIGGAVLAGLVGPLISFCYVYLSAGHSTQTLMSVASVAVVLRGIGDFTFRYSILKAGVFETII